MTAAGVEPLQGFTIGITAARRREELGAALARRGAVVRYAPAIRIVPLEQDDELEAVTRACLAAAPDFVVATTGIGYRGWIEAADTWGLGERLLAVLGASTLLARGPKARGAIRASGLREAWSPESESSAEVLEHLLAAGVAGSRVAVQLHGEPLPDVVDALRAAGAEVVTVPVYRWLPPADTEPLRRLVHAVAAREVQAVAFTSAPASASFLATADDEGVGAEVVAALAADVVAACVGPVTAGPLVAAGIPVVSPDRFRLGALVREMVVALPARLSRSVRAAGHDLDVRPQGVAVDGTYVPLAAAQASVLHALASDPGATVLRERLLAVLGEGADGHAVDVAVARLRTALGHRDVVTTVVKRGYRLAV